MARVLLTNADTNSIRTREDHPMGLVSLATFIRQGGHEARVHDSQSMQESTITVIKKFKPEIVGITCMTHARNAVFQLCQEIKQYNKNIKIVLGGPHLISTASQTLKCHRDFVDFVVRGYGEQAFIKLLDGENLQSITGLSFLEEGKIVETEFRGIPDPEDFIVPDYTFLNLKNYILRTKRRLSLPIFTSRGCCNKCIFCVAGSFSNRVVFAPLDMVFENIDRVKALGYRAIRIQDDTFGMKKKEAYQIIDYLKKNSIIYSIKSRVDILDEDFICALKKTGCYGIKFGVESIVPNVLSAMQKHIDLDRLERVINAGVKYGIKLGAYILIGNPKESYEDAMTTVRYCRELVRRGVEPIPAIGCYIFPGTRLEAVAKAEGLIPEDFDWAADFYDHRNKQIGYDPTIPVYTSKNIGHNELVSLNVQYKKRTDPKGFPVVRTLKKILPVPIVEKMKTIKRRHIKSSY